MSSDRIERKPFDGATSVAVRGKRIANQHVLDYLDWDETPAPCGAVVDFEGWR